MPGRNSELNNLPGLRFSISQFFHLLFGSFQLNVARNHCKCLSIPWMFFKIDHFICISFRDQSTVNKNVRSCRVGLSVQFYEIKHPQTKRFFFVSMVDQPRMQWNVISKWTVQFRPQESRRPWKMVIRCSSLTLLL